MEALFTPLQELLEFAEMKKALSVEHKSVSLTGCVDSQKLHMIYGLSDDFPMKVIVTYSDLKAKELYEDAKFYDKSVMLFPAKDLIFYQADIHGNQLITQRMKCYRKILEKKPVTIITTFSALMSPQIPLERLEKSIISIDKKTIIEEAALAIRLVEMGYEKTYQVEAPGQFSIRGGIIDIYDLTEENPYRIELWGDQVDSIRSFDLLSQRSVEHKTKIHIYPATEMILSREEISTGIRKMEVEAKMMEEKFRNQFLTEEANRIHVMLKDLKEQVEEFQSYVNLESYIHFFYPKTISFQIGRASCRERVASPV